MAGFVDGKQSILDADPVLHQFAWPEEPLLIGREGGYLGNSVARDGNDGGVLFTPAVGLHGGHDERLREVVLDRSEIESEIDVPNGGGLEVFDPVVELIPRPFLSHLQTRFGEQRTPHAGADAGRVHPVSHLHAEVVLHVDGVERAVVEVPGDPVSDHLLHFLVGASERTVGDCEEEGGQGVLHDCSCI